MLDIKENRVLKVDAYRDGEKIGSFGIYGKKWGFTVCEQIFSPVVVLSSEEHRQIADKLDELNKVDE